MITTQQHCGCFVTLV